MSEIPAATLQAATQAVLAHEWGGVRTAHRDHISDAECAVCRGDVEAILTVAAPVLATPRRVKPRIVCPVCSRDVVRRDDGKPISHYPPPGREELSCTGGLGARCRGGCKCRRHRA